jgi:hypothetical protein
MNDNPKLTITLTNRPPVSIRKADWPVLAQGHDKWYEGEHECQANRSTHWHLIVRRHADGRAIVYGIYKHYSAWRGEKGHDLRAGELLDAGADLIPAIHRMASGMQERVEHCANGEDAAEFLCLADECIADLPATELE